MKKAAFPLLLAMAACSSPGDDSAAAPSPSPDTFTIRLADLYRDPPNDICRSTDADFLQKLTDRVRSGVDPKFWPSFSFEDFGVRDADGEGRRFAAFRFKIDRGAGLEMMTAIGQIDPKTCVIGEMKLGAGANEMMFDDASTVTIQGV